MAQTGEGWARLDGKRMLVAGALPGELVRIRVDRNRVELLGVDVPSPSRVVPACAQFDACGGCAWQHASAEFQRDARLAQLRRALPGSFRDVAIAWHAAPDAYAYRSRARLTWSTTSELVVLGYRARGSHRTVDAAHCPVLVPALDAAIGPLRLALARVSRGGEVSIALGCDGRVVASIRPDAIPQREGFEAAARLVANGFAGVALWPPGATVASVTGDPRPMIRGGDGERLWLAPEGFAQANETLNTTLVREVRACADAGDATVLELYAGAGNFTVVLARDAARVTAVEALPAACAALRENLRHRSIANVSVLEGDAAQALESGRGEIVVLDPPRAGARDVCERLARRPPRRVVYVSCDPPTLGRDLATLAVSMDLVRLAAFEMFPQTPHVEVVATLRARSTARHRA